MNEFEGNVPLKEQMGTLMRLGNVFSRYDKIKPLDEAAEVEVINTASDRFVAVATLISQVLQDGGIRPGEFLENVSGKIEDSHSTFEHAKKGVTVVDDSLSERSESEAFERVLTIGEEDFMFWRRQIMDYKRAIGTDPKAEVKMKELMEICGASFDGNDLDINDGTFPRRDTRIRVPTAHIPVIYMRDKTSTERQDVLKKNSRAMEKIGYALGILDEGETWSDFIMREDHKALFEEHEKSRKSDGHFELFPEARAWDYIAPQGQLVVDTVFSDFKVGIRFEEDFRTLIPLSRRIKLQEALALGYATTNLELIVPTKDLMPLKDK